MPGNLLNCQTTSTGLYPSGFQQRIVVWDTCVWTSVSPKFVGEALSPIVTVFGDGAFKEGTEGQTGHKAGGLDPLGLVPLRIAESQETSGTEEGCVRAQGGAASTAQGRGLAGNACPHLSVGLRPSPPARKRSCDCWDTQSVVFHYGCLA